MQIWYNIVDGIIVCLKRFIEILEGESPQDNLRRKKYGNINNKTPIFVSTFTPVSV